MLSPDNHSGPKVDDLILVAAPSCCGKTRFLEHLLSGRLNDLAAELNIGGALDSYESIVANQVETLNGKQLPRLIYHYALPTIALNDGSIGELRSESRLSIVPSARNVNVITLIARPGVLTGRLALRVKSNRRLMFRKPSKYLSERRRLARLRDLYGDPGRIAVAYRAWFDYTQGLENLQHESLIDANDAYKLLPVDEWRSALGGESLRPG